MEDNTEQSRSKTLCLSDNRPEISQYTEPALVLRIGSHRTEYSVPRFLFKKYPKLLELTHQFGFSHHFGLTINLPEVDDDIGHTFVHYLYHDEYQTLKLPGATGPAESVIEYSRGILAYCTARLYEIEGLACCAMKAINWFGKDLTIAQILEAVRAVYAKLPQDEVWLPRHLKTQLETALELDETVFTREDFLEHIGGDVTFTRALVRMMANIYAEKSISSNISGKSPRGLQELDQPTAKQIDEEVPEDCSATEDSEHRHTPPPSPSVDDGHIDRVRVECILPGPPAITEAEDICEPGQELQVEPGLEPELGLGCPTLASLDGRTFEENGDILDEDGQVIGRLVEGVDKLKLLLRNKARCNAEGKVLAKGRQIPRVRVEVVNIETPAATDNQDLLPDAVENPTNKPERPTFASIAGKQLNNLGEIYNDDNVLVARLVVGNAHTLHMKQAYCNAKGDVIVNGKRKKHARMELVPLDEKDGVSPLPMPELESNVCLEQAQHLRDGGGWKTCLVCCTLVREWSIQLSNEDAAVENGPSPPPAGAKVEVS